MNNTDLVIVIPGAINAQPNSTLAERVVLAHIHKFPGCSNASLARLLGLSQRGVEGMLRRLRERDLIAQVGKGRARVHRLLFPVEHHIKCEENEAESHTKSGQHVLETHTQCGASAPPNPEGNMGDQAHAAAPANRETSAAKVVERELKIAKDCVGSGDFEGALRHYRLMRERVAALPDSVPGVKSEALALVIEDETRVLACWLAYQHARATKMHQSKLYASFALIKDLSRERLVELRPALDAQAKLGTPVDISALLAG